MIINISKLGDRSRAIEEGRRLLDELRQGGGDWTHVLRLRSGLATSRAGPESWAFSAKEIGLARWELDRLARELRLRLARRAVEQRRAQGYLGTIIDHYVIERALEDGITIAELDLTEEEIMEIEEAYGSLELAAQLKG